MRRYELIIYQDQDMVGSAAASKLEDELVALVKKYHYNPFQLVLTKEILVDEEPLELLGI